MVVALHVRLEGLAVLPPTDHQDLAGVAIGAPDLQVDEPVGVIDQMGAATERRDQFVRGVLGDPQARKGDVHRGAS